MENRKNKKKSFLIVIGICVILLLSAFFFIKWDKVGQRDVNIIVIVSDALRWDVLGCYGGNAATPNIDRLAKNGVLFENAYSTAPCTMPSAVSITTGNYSRTYGLTINRKTDDPKRKYIYYVNKKEKLLPKELKQYGYDVKMDVENQLASSTNNFQEFDEFRRIKQMSKEEIRFVEEAIPSGRKASSRYYRIYDLLHYLLTVPEDRHFFLVKWFLDPHAPYDPPEKFRKKISFNTAELPRDKNYYSNNNVKDFNLLIRLNDFSEKECAYIKALYKAEVESVDERVGCIIKALEQRKLLKKTIIVFTADHGEAFMEHGHLGHGHRFYETLVHIPLIFMGPGIPPGKREKAIVSQLDLMPTLKDLAGIQYSHQMQGKSYSTLFSGPSTGDRVPYFDRISNNITDKKTNSDALLMDGYKLIVIQKKNSHIFKLFNLTEDSGEMNDIAEENPDIVKKMLKKIMDLRKENKNRLEKNIANIEKGVELDEKWQKTMAELEALGYI
jgi:arylsulfatase A-like enzyme